MALYGGKKRSTVVIALLLIVHIACCTIAQVNLTPRLTNGTWTSRFENVAGATFQAPLKRGLRSLSGTQKMSTVIMKDVVAIDLGGGTLQLSTTVPQKSNFTKDTVKWSHGKSGTALRRLLQSSSPSVLWQFGKAYLPGVSGSTTSAIRLPVLPSSDDRFVVFTELPGAKKGNLQAFVYEVSTTGKPGSEFYISKLCCNNGDTAEKKLFVNYMALRTGVFEYESSAGSAYIAVGRTEITESSGGTVTLTKPGVPGEVLFPEGGIVLVQAQQATEKATEPLLSVQATLDKETLKIAVVPFKPGATIPLPLAVGYLVLEKQMKYSDATGNLVVSGSTLTSNNGEVTVTLPGVPQCGRSTTFGSSITKTQNDVQTVFVPQLSRPAQPSSSSEAFKQEVVLFNEFKCPTPNSYSGAITTDILSVYYSSGCHIFSAESVFITEIVSTTTRNPASTTFSNSYTIVWIAVCTVGGVAVLGALLYFLCVHKFGVGGGANNGATQLDDGAPPWNTQGLANPLGGYGGGPGNVGIGGAITARSSPGGPLRY